MSVEWFLRICTGLALGLPIAASLASRGGKLEKGVRLVQQNRQGLVIAWCALLIEVILAGILLVFMMNPAVMFERSRWMHVALPTWLQIVGGIILVVGGVLNAWPRVTLGKNWMKGMALHPQHTLITTGPYRLVRHPMYLGYCMLAAGTFLATRSHILGIMAALVAFVYCARIDVEDELLRKHFRKKYPAYFASTPALIPRFVSRLWPWRRRT